MSTALDVDRLDDPAALAAGDPQQMLRAVATSAAQVRRAATAAVEAGVGALADAGRPRAVVVAGMGGSGIAGDVLAAVTADTAPVPVLTHRGYGLPGWVGVADLVVTVSCSGSTEETLSAAEEAARRGCPMLAVAAPDSPLAGIAAQARAVLVPAPQGLQPRASLWSLAVPLLVAADALGVGRVPADALEAAAVRLEQVAATCHPDRETFVNPAKSLAVELAGSLPTVWGSGQVGGVAAYRTVCQLAENAKYPATGGALPEADHNLVVTFDGPYAGAGTDDFFRDRVADPEPTRLRLLLLRDEPAGADRARRRAEVSAEVARDRGVAVSEVLAEGDTPVERLASLVGLVDHASVYLALAHGLDPTPVAPIDELKARLA